MDFDMWLTLISVVLAIWSFVGFSWAHSFDAYDGNVPKFAVLREQGGIQSQMYMIGSKMDSKQSVYEWYKEQEAALKRAYIAQCNELEEELRKRQELCNHEWKHVSDLFYAMGETYDGDQCNHCGQKRHKRS